MKMKLENIPSYNIAYIRRTGYYGIGNIQTMEKLKDLAKSNDLFNDQSIILGIVHDNVETTNPENCRYDACIVVSNDNCIDSKCVSYGKIFGGSYAVFEVEHTTEALQKAWSEIFPELFSQGYKFDETRPILERYKVEMVNNHYCEICVPICTKL